MFGLLGVCALPGQQLPGGLQGSKTLDSSAELAHVMHLANRATESAEQSKAFAESKAASA
jgi:hypothetical protein